MSQEPDEQEGAAAAAPKAARRRGDPYEVGFARPPKATRFKKGRSGNPRGRPKTEITDVRGALDRVLQRRIRIVFEGEPRRASVLEALLLKIRERATAGDMAMQKLQLQLVGWLGQGAVSKPIDITGLDLRLKMAFGMINPDDVR